MATVNSIVSTTEEMDFVSPPPRRALSMLSGGLDSQLAICVLKGQGIDVHAVSFQSPFFDSAKARAGATQLGVPLHVIDFTRDIISLLGAPPHGFGSHMNPCIDCHARMLARTGELMEEMGFDFLSTGEVLNQRPMSQNRRSLDTVAGECGYGDLVVRPLSGGLLPATRPERQGWIERSKLLCIEGRSRKRQMQLADRYGLKDYPSPAGGCRLTEPNFCKRLRDLKEHEGLHGVRALTLLRFGRHFRLGPNVKAIVGRNENDNLVLEGNAELYDLILKVDDFPGPTGLLPVAARREDVVRAAAICARYSDAPHDRPVGIRIRSSKETERIEVIPADPAETDRLRI
jgi:hypothetical protein